MKLKTVHLLGIFIFIILLISKGSLVHANELDSDSEKSMHTESIEIVLQDLILSQGVSRIQELDCNQISDDEFELLGDAVMEERHPGESHEFMDEMMGGEGSESLREAHIAMGSSYLGCSSGYNNGYMMGSGTGMGMMGYSRNGSMMRSYDMYSIFHIATWIAGISFLVSGTYYFIKKSNRK